MFYVRRIHIAFGRIGLHSLLIAGFILFGGGCSQKDRQAAQALAKSTISSATAYHDYQASVQADQERLVVTNVINAGGPLAADQRFKGQRDILSLRARTALAQQLLDMANAASGVLNYSPDDAKKAADGLADKIAAVNHHTFQLPANVAAFLPADKRDPKEYLNDAVAAMVEAEALKDYRQALPKILQAVEDVALSFEVERFVYAGITSRRLSNDFKIVAEARRLQLSIDVSFLEPSFDTFNLKYLPSAIPSHPTSTLPSGIISAVGEQLHAQIAARITAGGTVANELFAVEKSLEAATDGKHRYPCFSSEDFSDPSATFQVLKLAKDHKPAPGEVPTEEWVVRRAVAARISEGDWKLLANPRTPVDKKTAILATAANGVVAGPALFPVAYSAHDKIEFPPDPVSLVAIPNLVQSATLWVQYTGPERANGGGQYYVPVPPAGFALAGVQFQILRNDLIGGNHA